MAKLSFYINEVPTVVEFPNNEAKDAYVLAEAKNIKCQKAYFEYQACKNNDDRKKLSSKMYSVRYNFYKNWTAKNTPSNVVPLRPNEPSLA
jgi:hypothetical protein